MPNAEQIRRVDTLIMDELTLGVFRAETRLELLTLCQALQAQGAARVILGCTELPLLFTDEQMRAHRLVSSMELHCQAIVAHALHRGC